MCDSPDEFIELFQVSALFTWARIATVVSQMNLSVCFAFGIWTF